MWRRESRGTCRTAARGRAAPGRSLKTDTHVCVHGRPGQPGLWERHPEAMRAALARHDELIESAARDHGGTIVRPGGEGDSRFVVFADAADAVRAACSMQLRLQQENWPTTEP